MKIMKEFSLTFLACFLALIAFACITEDDEAEERVCSPIQEDLDDEPMRDSYQVWHEKKS